MAFNPCLLVMQPREIQDCLDSIKECFDIPTVYFRAFSEPMVCREMSKYIRENDYTHYIIVGDDHITTKPAAQCVLDHTEDSRYEVFTGWMNMHLEENGFMSQNSTVSYGPLVQISDPTGPTREEYGKWEPMQIIRGLPAQPFRTAYANFALTGATKELWERFPLSTHTRGNSSDHQLSYRLQTAGVKVWSHPSAFIKHLRRGWRPLLDKWLVWNVPSEIIETNRSWGKREDYART